MTLQRQMMRMISSTNLTTNAGGGNTAAACDNLIGVAVIIVFTMEAISKKSDASKEYKKKRIDNLEKINEKLDDIIRTLRH